MSDRDKGRLVYSTGLGSICPGCGWPDKDCKCSSQQAASDAIPKRIVAKLRMEKKGRGGKTVTVVDGLPNNAAFLKELCSELKRACGTGGADRRRADRAAGRSARSRPRLPDEERVRRQRLTYNSRMPKLTVEGYGTVEVADGKRLVLAIEQDAKVDILHACGGNARCTTCRVEFIDGEPASAHRRRSGAARRRRA